MKNLYLILLIIPFLACKEAKKENLIRFQPKTCSYKEMKAPLFFETLVVNHSKDFHSIDSTDLKSIFSENNLSETDSINLKKFYTFKILHKLFTSKGAKNGSRGEILNIPYFWHWITPNPRYEIVNIKTNQKLNEVKAPKEFAKYKSYADIDRTPYLFLSELLSSKPLYSTANCGTFSTFGWCSEREMAFVCLLNTIGYEGKVITDNNHSWSEFIVQMSTEKKEKQYFLVRVDNTFDDLEWNTISEKEIQTWRKRRFEGQGNWYNQKANSEMEKQKTTNFIVSLETMKSIEEKLVYYLSQQ